MHHIWNAFLSPALNFITYVLELVESFSLCSGRAESNSGDATFRPFSWFPTTCGVIEMFAFHKWIIWNFFEGSELGNRMNFLDLRMVDMFNPFLTWVSLQKLFKPFYSEWHWAQNACPTAGSFSTEERSKASGDLLHISSHETDVKLKEAGRAPHAPRLSLLQLHKEMAGLLWIKVWPLVRWWWRLRNLQWQNDSCTL